MIEWFGPVILEYYGATEIGIVVTCDSHEWLAHEGAVGKPFGTADIRVFDPAGELLPPGETGEIYVRPPRHWPGFTYLDQEDRRREIERDGYITIGDVGRMDEDGFLHLSDRARDMVISGGVNIKPAEIEAWLLELDGVRDVAVFGIPDDDFGEALAAHVDAEPSAGLTETAVRNHVGARNLHVKAVVQDTSGRAEALRIADVVRPIPNDGEVLISVRATAINRTDTGLPRGRPLVGRVYAGLLHARWRILGTELAGEVVSVGAAVTEFRPGDEVFGINVGRFGTHAEFVCMRESAPLAPKPADATFEQAAAVCDGAILALNSLRPARLRAGQRILVYGASGSVGTAAVQLARYFDLNVTAVCNPGNVELVRSLGADQVIDYTREDFTKNGELYDAIFDAVGKHSFRRCRASLATTRWRCGTRGAGERCGSRAGLRSRSRPRWERSWSRTRSRDCSASGSGIPPRGESG
jgi:NADPH:quinone reductase-like Zn-dependent oxidoreductase